MATAPIRPGRPGLMRAMNDRAALTVLLEGGPMTRQQIGDVTGLSGPTTSQLIKRLSEAGLVRSAGRTRGSRGPDAAVYQACTEAFRGVALDVRANRVAARFVDAGSQPYPVAEVRPAGRQRSAQADLSNAIEAACQAAGRDPLGLQAICVGLPGAVATATDDLRFANDLPGWPRHAVRAQLSEHLGVEVLLENDANLAATAEAWERPAEGDFALLWQGEGLGVAFISGGRVHRGAAGGAGEIGYLPVSHTAAGIDPMADDLQDLAGARAVTRLAKAHREAVRTFDAAVEAIADSDLRPALLAELAPRIAELIVPVIAVLDPSRIVLGGPTGAACGSQGASMVQAHLRRTTRWRTPIVATAVRGNPTLRGAELTLVQHLSGHLLGRVG